MFDKEKDEQFVPITPINFFQLSLNCSYVKPHSLQTLSNKKIQDYRMPDLSSLCGDEKFANVFMGWNEDGIEIIIKIEKKFEEVYYPDITKGDSVEFFFDTRDVKTSGYNTRFCHHFFFLPESVEGYQKGEKTHFRSEDSHELCDPTELKLKSVFNNKEYILYLEIPKNCLFSYDPDQFDRMGFTYRINRPHLKSQHFSVITEDYQLEQQPSLWCSIKLIK
jgi:hypothetical protein